MFSNDERRTWFAFISLFAGFLAVADFIIKSTGLAPASNQRHNHRDPPPTNMVSPPNKH